MPWFSQPYTVERRPDTGVNSVALGMWLFLGSEAILFAALFSVSLRLRAGSPEPWLPLRGQLGVGSINTIVLLGAGLALTFALRAARRNDVRVFRRLLQLAGWLALVFIGVKLDEYGDLHGHHLLPAANNQAAMYFLLTGIHLFHVTGGALAIAWIGLGRRDRRESLSSATLNRVEAVLRYWYLLVVVWLMVFVLFYVV